MDFCESGDGTIFFNLAFSRKSLALSSRRRLGARLLVLLRFVLLERSDLVADWHGTKVANAAGVLVELELACCCATGEPTTGCETGRRRKAWVLLGVLVAPKNEEW